MVHRILFIFIFLVPSLQPVRAQLNGDASTINIFLKAIPGLQYDLVRFVVKPGADVTLSLANTDDMSHNVLITKPGARLAVVNAALQLAEKGPQLNYTPRMEEVLWAVPVVSPGQTKSVSFKAPAQPGAYPYVCTYPGHGFVMFGVMYVSRDGAMPAMASDINIPESRRADSAGITAENMHAGHDTTAASPHPYALVPPYLYRVFIEGASPAAIAVRLPNDLSYCWDAGTCKLRFAWKGGFIDNTDLWKGHFDASAKILGDVFFRDNLDYPLHVTNETALPVVKWKGYRLVEKYPEFHYTVNGLDVYELIRATADGYGLTREFRIPAASGPVYFDTNRQDDAIGYTCSAGSWKDGSLSLTSAEAKQFTITMDSYHLRFQRKKK